MNPFDVPTPPKKQSKEEYEDMFPSGQQNHAARMYAEDDDDSPWSQEQQRNTRYTQSAEYHRSIESDLRSASNGVASVASEGYYGRNEYEEEEEEEVMKCRRIRRDRRIVTTRRFRRNRRRIRVRGIYLGTISFLTVVVVG